MQWIIERENTLQEEKGENSEEDESIVSMQELS